MYAIKRVFLIVLDSLGIGALPDAAEYGDEGSNTLASVMSSDYFNAPTLTRLGLFNIDGIKAAKQSEPIASFARLAEKSKGKDTTTGHWEIAGVVSEKPFPTYPSGFPDEIIDEFMRRTGRGVLCNKPYSGTQVIKDFGLRHVDTGELIVYTSADSVFQIAAHEAIIPVEKLYEYCLAAREIMTGEHAVGRIIARPFSGIFPDFKRTARRHDFSLSPPSDTLLDVLKNNGFGTVAVGKISDIFAAKGITRSLPIKNNDDGMKITIELLDEDFTGLCFVNLVDFDMLYGHRNDIDGYALALSQFDLQLSQFLLKMHKDDVLIITADHGCDPATASTDHSREYAPMLVCGEKVKQGVNLGTGDSLSDIAATVAEIFNIENKLCGKSFLGRICYGN